MSIIEKALAAVLKDIGTILHTIDTGPASGSLREYSTAKANYFNDKAEEDVKKWLAEID